MSKIRQRQRMSKPIEAADGLVSFQNSLANRRNASSNNSFTSERILDESCRAIYKTGIGNKIIRLKTSNLLNDTLVFDNEEAERYFYRRLQVKVEEALRWALVFGRGIMVIQDRMGADLSKPLTGKIDLNEVQVKVFSGDMVSVAEVDLNLSSPRYYKPKSYSVRGATFHHSRVIDVNYIMPSEFELPEYRYGGISEFQLIRDQLVNDGIVQRVIPHIVEKNSTIFYKVDGFKDLLASGREGLLINYFQQIEDHRSIYGAGILDKSDDIEPVSQAMTNLNESDMITLRRLAMVTSIPMSVLVGESAKGLNATGEMEMTIFQEMKQAIQSDHLAQPLQDLFDKLGLGDIYFKPNQGESPSKKIEYEAKAIDNALKLWQMGEDANLYLQDRGVLSLQKIDDDFAKLFGDDDATS
jgi:hypothetical protein